MDILFVQLGTVIFLVVLSSYCGYWIGREMGFNKGWDEASKWSKFLND